MFLSLFLFSFAFFSRPEAQLTLTQDVALYGRGEAELEWSGGTAVLCRGCKVSLDGLEIRCKNRLKLVREASLWRGSVGAGSGGEGGGAGAEKKKGSERGTHKGRGPAPRAAARFSPFPS